MERVRADQEIEREPGTARTAKDEPLLPALAMSLTPGVVTMLQRAAGNRAVAGMVSGSTLQREKHRPGKGATIVHGGSEYEVTQSPLDADVVQVKPKVGKKLHERDFNWRENEYWILRPEGAHGQDADRRTQPGEAALGFGSVRRAFDAAKPEALMKIKDYARPKLIHTAVPTLDALDLMSFTVTQRQPSFDLGMMEACEWQLEWPEGDAYNPRRMWKFIVDADRPPATSDQEPHVGWSASAEKRAPTGTDVARQLGHICLDDVPVGRKALNG